jgi:transcriptional regulator with XRE-family HTH domain
MMTTPYPSPVDQNKGELARLIGELLASRGMSQVQLARDAGVSESHVSRILSGEYLPAPDKLTPLAEALGVDVVMIHRAYAASLGLRLEGVQILNEGMAAVMADWPDAPPEVRVAALSAARAVLEAFGNPESQKDSGKY